MVDELIQQGLRQHQQGRIHEAKLFYEQALALKPRHPDALHLLGLIALQSGEAAQALELIRQAVALQPRNWAFLANLGAALIELKRYPEARSAFQRAAKFNPDNPQLRIGVANCFALAGNFAEAESHLRTITRQFPSYALGWLNLGNAVRDQQRALEAITLYRRAIEADPALADAYNNLGSLLHALPRFEEAESSYRRALELNPEFVMARCNLVSILIDRGRFAEAETEGRQAVASAPDLALAYTFLSAAIGHQGRLREALELDLKAIALEPNNARILMATGSALHEVGKSRAGLHLLERALALAPESWEAHFTLSTVELALGLFEEGWRDFLYRPARTELITRYPNLTMASEMPDKLHNLHVCVLREQGLGDELFFLRFARFLKARGARLTYRTNPKLSSILERVGDLDRVIPNTEPTPAADYLLTAGDLPLAACANSASPLGTRVAPSKFPAGAVYAFIASLPKAYGLIYPDLPRALELTPLPDRLASLTQRLSELGPPPYRGLTWRGGTAPAEQGRDMAWMLFKQIPFKSLAAALEHIDGTFLALQRNPEPGEIDEFGGRLKRPLHDLCDLNEDLESMLALLALLDDYIGVSNTNMHLRAGVGKTARVLVPCPAEWRWMAKGARSPWFPGFSIYRQENNGDWSDALAQLTADLGASARRPQT